MLALVRSVQLGDTGSASLLRRDGSIVYDRGAAANSNARFWAADAVQSRMHGERQAGSIGGKCSSRLRLATALRTSSGWPTASSRRAILTSRGSLPYRRLRDELPRTDEYRRRDRLALVAAAAIVVLALALWFSIRLAAPQVDIDMHLVQHPAGYPRRRAVVQRDARR